MADKIALIRTATGEYFLGMKKEQENADVVVLTQARNLVPQMTKNGVGVAAAQIVPFAIKSPDEISIPKNLIMAEIPEENIIASIISGYKSEITGLDLTTAATPEIIT